MEMSEEEPQRIKLQQLTSHLSDRMKRLCAEVLQRLPDGWDENITFDFEESEETPELPESTIDSNTASAKF